jgi:hypothetical protein
MTSGPEFYDHQQDQEINILLWRHASNIQTTKGASYVESAFFSERAERKSVKTFSQNDAQVGQKV